MSILGLLLAACMLAHGGAVLTLSDTIPEVTARLVSEQEGLNLNCFILDRLGAFGSLPYRAAHALHLPETSLLDFIDATGRWDEPRPHPWYLLVPYGRWGPSPRMSTAWYLVDRHPVFDRLLPDMRVYISPSGALLLRSAPNGKVEPFTPGDTLLDSDVVGVERFEPDRLLDATRLAVLTILTRVPRSDDGGLRARIADPTLNWQSGLKVSPRILITGLVVDSAPLGGCVNYHDARMLYRVDDPDAGEGFGVEETLRMTIGEYEQNGTSYIILSSFWLSGLVGGLHSPHWTLMLRTRAAAKFFLAPIDRLLNPLVQKLVWDIGYYRFGLNQRETWCAVGMVASTVLLLAAFLTALIALGVKLLGRKRPSA